jgi:hypothetical protein
MDLTGHHSNPSRPLRALLDSIYRQDIKRLETSMGRSHRRHDWVQEAVIRVLEQRKAPMQAREVHAAVEALLGEPVQWGSIKGVLGSQRRRLVASVRTGCPWALRRELASTAGRLLTDPIWMRPRPLGRRFTSAGAVVDRVRRGASGSRTEVPDSNPLWRRREV